MGSLSGSPIFDYAELARALIVGVRPRGSVVKGLLARYCHCGNLVSGMFVPQAVEILV